MAYSRVERQYSIRSNKLECVLFDTSALLMMFTGGIRLMDYITEIMGIFIPVVTTSVVIELKKLSESNRSIARVAVTALNYILSKFSVADTQGSADDSIVEVASKYGCVVVTCDNKLRSRLRAMGVRVIYYRESSNRFEADFT